MHYIWSFFCENLIGLLACIGLLVVMHMKSRVGEKNVWALRAGTISIIILMISEFADTQMGNADYGGGWRYFTSTLNYIIRPLQAMFLIFQVRKNRKWNAVLIGLWGVYVLLMLINLPTHIIFHFDPSFGATGFGAIRIFFPLAYVILVVVSSVASVREKELAEVILVSFLALAIIIASLIEWNNWAGGDIKVITPCEAICYVFYYLYLHIASSKRDPLTDLLNRQSYYDDLKTKEKFITAVVSLDMNDLKLLNDSNGHSAGDEALATLADIFRKNRVQNSRIYRVGGDEFMILAFNLNPDEVGKMVDSINEDVAETRYSCAIGYSVRNDYKPVEVMIFEADEAMYDKKRSMKTTEVR